MKKLIGTLLLISALLGACQKNISTYTPDCSGDTKSYSNEVDPIFQQHCIGCHQNYASYAKIYADRSSIQTSVAEGIMPPEGSLSDTQKNTILCWIENGAPNN
jgi:cytochrome c551/c552